MFGNVTGGAGTYAKYLFNEFSSTDYNNFDFYILTHDVAEENSNILKVDIESDNDLSFYKKMIFYRKRLDQFMANTDYESYILHANSAIELSRFLDIDSTKIANVNDYEVVNAFRLIPLYFKIYGLRSFKKIIGKLRARLHEKKVLSHVDLVVANSRYTLDCLKRGYEMRNVKTIYKSCDVSIFDKKPQISVNTYTFLFVANDWRKKGLSPLLEAFSMIKRKGFKDAKLTLVGIPDLDYDEVIKKVEGLGLSKSVCVHGNLNMDKLVRIYRENCYLIVPAYIESLGISILEALSCGLIVAVANRGGMTEIIDDGVNGFVFKHLTPKSISDMLIKMMALTDSEKSKILAESDKTLLFFNSVRMIKEVRGLYSSFLK